MDLKPVLDLDEPGQAPEQSVKSVPLLSDVVFESEIGRGGFGIVWSVRAMQYNYNTKKRTQVLLACKTVRLTSDVIAQISQGAESDQVVEGAVGGEGGEGAEEAVGEELSSNRVTLGDMLTFRYLKHEHICQLIDLMPIKSNKTDSEYKPFCLFMELCSGDLDQIIDQSPNKQLSEQQTKHWFRHIIEAVDYLHSKHVVHNDISCANILYTKLTQTDEPVLESIFKLGDFGLAVLYAPNDESLIYSMKMDLSELAEILIRCLLGKTWRSWYASKDLSPQELIKKFGLNEDLVDLVIEMQNKRISSIDALAHLWTIHD